MCEDIEVVVYDDNNDLKSIEVAIKEEIPKRPRGRPHKVREEVEKVPKTIGRPRKYEVGQKVIYERKTEYFQQYYKDKICKEVKCPNCSAHLMSVAALKRHEKQNENCNIKALETENKLTKQFLNILLSKSYKPEA